MKMFGILTAILLTSAPSHEVRLDDPRLTVSFKTDQAIFPPEWINPEISPVAEPIKTNEEASCVQLLKNAFAKYPTKLTEANLKTVYISRFLTFYGLHYGGTNSSDSLYLTLSQNTENYYNLRMLERALHHEYSSILLRNYPQLFPISAWTAANPPDFKYRGDGIQSLREGTASTKYSKELNEQGFLAQYSTSSIEEDFNMFAEAMFSGDLKFWETYDKFPAIAKKADLTIAFYNRIDPTFTKLSFAHLAQAHTQ